MKNRIKKIAAITVIAMALAFLGLGNDVVRTISPQTNITLTAHALSWNDPDYSTPQGGCWPMCLYCKHKSGTYKSWSSWYHDDWDYAGYQETLIRYRVKRCNGCGAILSFDFDDYETKLHLW